MGLKVVTNPAVKCVSLSEAKAQCVVLTSDDDALIDSMIDVAIEQAQDYTQRQLNTAEYAMTMDSLLKRFEIPRPPLVSVDAIEYIPAGGTEYVALDPSCYMVDDSGMVGIVARRYGMTYPDTEPVFAAVKVAFTCGYGDEASDVPVSIRHWILRRVTHLYEHRGEENIIGASVAKVDNPFNEYLLRQYRVSNR